jgi:hypothetical protein
MAKYVFIYQGGSMAEDEAAIAATMAAWGQWFGDLGPAVVDEGNPFGASAGIGTGGRRTEAAAGATGYSIVTAADLEAAADLAKGCPVLAHGGAVAVYEALAM